jgi:hypothetical protein
MGIGFEKCSSEKFLAGGRDASDTWLPRPAGRHGLAASVIPPSTRAAEKARSWVYRRSLICPRSRTAPLAADVVIIE